MDQRQLGKSINFAFIYGPSTEKLMTNSELRKLMEEYMTAMKTVKDPYGNDVEIEFDEDVVIKIADIGKRPLSKDVLRLGEMKTGSQDHYIELDKALREAVEIKRELQAYQPIVKFIEEHSMEEVIESMDLGEAYSVGRQMASAFAKVIEDNSVKDLKNHVDKDLPGYTERAENTPSYKIRAEQREKESVESKQKDTEMHRRIDLQRRKALVEKYVAGIMPVLLTQNPPTPYGDIIKSTSALVKEAIEISEEMITEIDRHFNREEELHKK